MGKRVGFREGNNVGCCFVGVKVGLEGTTVGFGEGLDVGWPVGCADGKSDG